MTYVDDGLRLVCELDGSGNVSAVLSWGAAGLYARGSVQYLGDYQGSVVQRTDAQGSVLSHHVYDGYGSERTTPSGEPHGYKGQFGYTTDEETGLILCTFRYYDPGRGRWLNRDPIGYAGGINLYGYCGGEPVGGYDPVGLSDAWLEAQAREEHSQSIAERADTYGGMSGQPPMGPLPGDNQGAPGVRPGNGSAGTGGGSRRSVRPRRVYRTMRRTPEGRPEVGESARQLGVRPGIDIDVDGNGMVNPGSGMSVAPDNPMNLPEHRRPSYLPGGSSKDPLWSLDPGQLPPGLGFVQDSPTHGFIGPVQQMPYASYVRLLHSSGPMWVAE